MIKIAGSAKLSFTLPTDLETAFAYYSDIERVLSFIKYITIINAEDGRYRLQYDTIELGAYHIQVVCDVMVEQLVEERVVKIIPIDALPPVPSQSSMSGTSGRGTYSSEARFAPDPEGTRIDYTLSMHAALQPPLGLRFMPGRITGKIAQNITTRRLKEVADSFIEESKNAFPLWSRQFRPLKSGVKVESPAQFVPLH